MKILRYFFIFCIAVMSGAVSAQDQDELLELMRSRGEYYFTVSVNTPAEAGTINRICSVDATDGKIVTCYANQREFDEMIKAGYKPFLQMPPSMRETHTMWDGKSKDWNSYPTYSQYESMMQGFPAQTVSGRTCTYIELGTLNSGRKLMGVRINNGSPEGKPKFLYTSTMHGDETTGMILMLRLIDELCTSNDRRITNLVNNLDIFIFPNTNPDGTYYGGNNTVSGARRYNINGVDLNRHFPDFNHGAHPDNASSYQNEAQWMMNLAQQYLFTMSANFHGGAEVVNYPWDNTYDRHADDAWWQYVSAEYVSNARQVSSSYMTDTYSSGVTNGADWYVITGSRQDYMNYYAQCREVTIECSSTKNPSASQLPTFWNYNHNAMLAYMEQCLKGVHGIVKDATTNAPIEGVTVTVQDHDHHGSAVSTHSAGDFHRPIKGDTYTFLFQKDGYCPQFVEVTVADGERVDLNDIQLTPGNCLMPNFTASSTTVSTGKTVNFTDASFGTVASYSWTFEGATPATSTVKNPSNIKYNTAGDFDVTLTITDAEGNSQTLTKSNYIHVAEAVNMHSGSVTTCSGIFYDSGGPSANYGNSLDYTLKFYPGSDDAKVCVDFQEFEIESGYDYLYIYDGTSTSATLIGQYSGSNSPGTVTATNASGALTFRFTSDYSLNKKGWVATVSCVYPTIELANNGYDNSSVISDANDKIRNVKLSNRTIYKDGTWNTLCLPFDVKIGSSVLKGAIAKTLEGASIQGRHVSMIFGDPVAKLLAGVPYIIKWEKAAGYDNANPNTRDIKNPVFQNVLVTSTAGETITFGGVSFVGYYDALDISAEDSNIYYLMGNNDLRHTATNRTLKPFRAYFDIQKEPNGDTREFVMDFGDGCVTGIEESPIATRRPSLQGWYTLDGRRLNGMPTAKGIYLYDGRAVVIR